MRFAPHVRTVESPFSASAGTSTIALNDTEDLKNDYIAHSEWTITASSIRENDVGRCNFYLLYGGDCLKVSQMLDLGRGEYLSRALDIHTNVGNPDGT